MLPNDLHAFPTLLLAQDAPGLAGQPVQTAPSASTAAPGGTPVGQPAPATGADSSFLFMMLAFVAVLIGTQIWASRKDKKKRESMLGGLKKNDRVQTADGLIGAIVELKPETVVLKVDENSNTRITFAKSAIVAILTSSDAEKAESKA